jgi:transmembrane sensor
LKQQVKQLFLQYIKNLATREEAERVISMINAGGHEEEWEAAMREAEPTDTGTEHADENDFPGLDTALLYQRINSKVFTKENRSPYRWMAYAAAILVLLGAAFLLHQPVDRTNKVLPNRAGLKPVARPGLRKWIKLPDGTSVQLNVDSKLDYPETFDGKTNREVTLSGEAYFDVKHDLKHPFVIHTGNLKTTVLGTAFNISAYPSAKTITVTVTRGKVMVQDGSKTLGVLIPNQQITWNAGNAIAQKHVVNAEEEVAWKSQDLIMDDVSLQEAADMIASRYKVRVIFKNDKVKQCRFTAAFLNRNELRQVITVLTDITNASYDLKANTLYIDGPGCDN